ncbi:MAG: hypothetical protein COT81_00490 [Candidatus Buchananbacteria bacterium CG10_big_fil_rev_8_21_14_0_10_42_9]|uniref:WxL domain-containing protein n=1 Tax=Candidatus Buchananbacteria bacterium CG10_big_fil_rev_8_21_14_0_10_42_9 TaxID=1974526 RepID=A0A2H0W4Q0_9BACT|nr:MAG: hypothetical protein COT81_00490 [Candidatus Buchananbacteria bacterium CG10_big_fil_rev_8_21_14_0_10_42_9]
MDYHFLKRFLLSVGTGFIVFVPVVLGAVRSSENYQILSDTFVSGGGYSSSDNYQLQDIVGEGVVNSATSTSANFGVKSGFFETFGETLTFSLGASSLELGQLDAAVTKTGSHTMSAATDIDNGFNINVSGSTLSSGANIIDAMSTTAASATGLEQFGLNVVANTSPSVGSDPSGTAPIGAAANNYNTANSFRFVSGEVVATSTAPINTTTFTVSYIANIAGATESGTYTTTLTYTATPVF